MHTYVYTSKATYIHHRISEFNTITTVFCTMQYLYTDTRMTYIPSLTWPDPLHTDTY